MQDRTGRGDGPPLAIAVVPAPADDELAALAVACAALFDARDEAPALAPETPPWAAAGRRDAVRGAVRVSDRGWGRRAPSR